MKAIDAYVSIGTNLGDRAEHLVAALRGLAALSETRLVACSPIFETAPYGPPPQGPYLNASAHVVTSLAPRALLDGLLAIERRAGRVRGAVNAARTLDLDLLLYGDRSVDEAGLVVPHARLAERAFVLEPLAALTPTLVHPLLGERIETLAARMRDLAIAWRWSGDDAAFRARLGGLFCVGREREAESDTAR